MGKGSNTTTTASNSASSTSPDSNAYQAYLALLQRAGGVASTPYQGYGGEQVAPINEQQQAGIGAINTQQGVIAGTGAPLSQADIDRYQDPYTSEVINATQRDFDVQNARQQSQVTGNAAAQGALGGDRSAVAAALAAEGQNRTQAPIIANLRSQGYQNAVKTAEDQQQQALRAGVAGLQGGQAMVGAGTLQQQTQQAQDTQNRLDYYQQQGYPFQVAQWLAQIDTGVGSQMGGTSSSTGTTTKQGPTPNPWAQVAGLGLTAAGMFANRGGRVSGVHAYADGGGIDDVEGFAMGGMPWSGEAQSWVPQVSGIAAGRGAPQAPSFVQAAGDDKAPGLSKDQMKGIGAIGKAGTGWLSDQFGGDVISGAWGGSSSSPLPGLSPDDYGAGYDRGGRVRRYANGGYAFGGSPDDDTTFDDRFGAAFPNRVVAGVGASRPAFSVVNSDEPYRMPSQDAVESWRSGVDRDIGRGVTEQPKGGEPVELPPEVISGRTKPAPVADEEPAEAMGYAGRPRMVSGVGAPPAAPEAPDESFLGRLGVKMTPELKQGLLQAGLAMMATRHGGPGSFLQSAGEAGMAGVGAYNQTAQAALDQAEKLRKEGFEREKFERPYSEMTVAQKEAVRHQKALEAKEFKPTYGVIREETDPDTGLSRKIYGWIDPNKQKVSGPDGGEPSISPAAKPKSVYVDETGQPVTGDAFIKRLSEVSPERANRAKLIGDYKVNPSGLSVRGGRREQALADAAAYNPDYDQRHYTSSQAAIKNFEAGVESRTVRSLNVAIDHLATLDDAAKALKNGDYPLLNKVVNAYRQNTGSELVTNFDSIKQVVSAEIAKSVVGGQTALHDRDDMARRASNAQSPEQLMGITQQFRKLMAGQMKGLRRTYESTTKMKNFEDYLEPETKKALKGLEHTVEDNYGKDKPEGKDTPKKGERKQFKQGWGVWDGSKWVPE